MAYFPNGTAGEVLDNQCSECIHASDGVMCPVYYVQATYNYSQSDNSLLEGCLQHLVRDDGTCQMKRAIEMAGIQQKPKPEMSLLEQFDNDRSNGRV